MSALKDRIGTYGVWRNIRGIGPDFAPYVEGLGFTTLWIGGANDFGALDKILASTETLVVASGITSIWAVTPQEAAEGWKRLSDTYPRRFVLGIGVSHPERVPQAKKPYEAMVKFLDGLDEAGVPVEERVLAALGPKMLALAADRADGAHPYLVTPDYTRDARAMLGPSPLLAPEQRVVLRSDPDEARALGRPSVQKPYLGLVNYRTNLKRLGYTDADLDNGGSDQLIDALVGWGSADKAAARLTAHLAAGADHVSVQVIEDSDEHLHESLAAVAEALSLQR